MTSTEMETLLKNLDARVARVERILPTLATREDLTNVERGLRTDLTAEIHASAHAVRAELTEQIRSSAQTLRTELTEQIGSSAHTLRAELTEQIGTSANGLRVLIEASRDETRVLAEHVLDLVTRFPRSR